MKNKWYIVLEKCTTVNGLTQLKTHGSFGTKKLANSYMKKAISELLNNLGKSYENYKNVIRSKLTEFVVSEFEVVQVIRSKDEDINRGVIY